MARIAIRVSGQRQKHGASLLGEIAKWLLRFSGDHHLTTPDTSIPADLRQTSAAVPATVATAAAVVIRRRRRYQRHRAGGRRRRRRRRVFRCRF